MEDNEDANKQKVLNDLDCCDKTSKGLKGLAQAAELSQSDNGRRPSQCTGDIDRRGSSHLMEARPQEDSASSCGHGKKGQNENASSSGAKPLGIEFRSCKKDQNGHSELKCLCGDFLRAMDPGGAEKPTADQIQGNQWHPCKPRNGTPQSSHNKDKSKGAHCFVRPSF